MKVPKNLVPLREAAALAGVHRSTLHRWRRAGKLRGWRRLGDTRTFVDLEELGRVRGELAPTAAVGRRGR